MKKTLPTPETTMIVYARRFYEAEIRLLTRMQPVFLLAVRLYWGYQFFLTGRGKLMNIERTASFFASLHIPLPLLNAYMAGATECFCGLMLLIGLASRFSTIPLIVTMCVAYATAHTQELGQLFSNPDAFVSAPPFLFLLASTIVLIFGAGWISADGLIQHYALGRCPIPSTGSLSARSTCAVACATCIAVYSSCLHPLVL